MADFYNSRVEEFGGSYSGSSDEFYMDTGAVADIVQNISKVASEYQSKLDEITKTVNGIENSWNDQYYQDWKSGYTSNLNKLNDPSEALNSFADILNNKISNTCDVATTVSRYLEGGN